MPKAEHLMFVGARDAGYKDNLDADFYETPPLATLSLVESYFLDRRISIWEPACGYGAISEVLRNLGFTVVSSDIQAHGYGKVADVFAVTEPFMGTIVTNPPYSIATEFVDHCCNLAPRCAFLLRLAFLEGQKRKLLFQKHKLARVLVFSKRLPRMHRIGYDGPKTSSTIAFAWFCFDSACEHPPQIEWV